MPRALILVTDGSEEIEFVTPYDGTLNKFRLKKTYRLLEMKTLILSFPS